MYFEKERYTLQRLSPADVNRIEKNSSVKCRFGSCPSLPTPKRFGLFIMPEGEEVCSLSSCCFSMIVDAYLNR
uniref:Uncharacterized protein n=1 Tax=Daphnia magna TaxID=35525 RepID=A0A0P6GTZ1_9CRUS